jgi:hypothetical protein
VNIFKLSNCPVESARFYQDIHIKKIIVETSQILANAYDLQILTLAPKTQSGQWRKHSYPFHPITKWAIKNISNFNWTLKHAVALCEEYKFRFNKPHFCESFINWCTDNNPNLSLEGLTEQPQCFLKHPDCMVKNDPVTGYRNYYNKCKLSFDFRGKIKYATWTNRDVPPFIDKTKLNIS